MIARRVSSTMKQLGLGLNLSTKKTRKREFLDEMNRVVPWAALVAVVEPHAPRAKTGRPPFAIEAMLRIHYLQQWFGLSDPAMEEALHDVPLYREFAGLDVAMSRLPDESTILRFRHLLEAHDSRPIILRLAWGSDTPASALRNWRWRRPRSPSRAARPANISITMGPSFRRSRPWSTKTPRAQLELVRIVLRAGGDLPEHAAPGEITLQGIEGCFELGTPSRTRMMGTRRPGAPYSARAGRPSRCH